MIADGNDVRPQARREEIEGMGLVSRFTQMQLTPIGGLLAVIANLLAAPNL